MKIVHFSDPHAGGWPHSGSAFFDKRIVGAFNYNFRRKSSFKIERLRSAVEKTIALGPQIAIITGDLTSVSEPWEFEVCREILSPLVNSDIKLIYIPGNHDAYVTNKRCREALNETFHHLNQRRWHLNELPLNHKVGDVNLMILNEATPTGCFLSCGQLCAESAAAVNTPLEPHEIRIVVGHFPVRNFKGQPLSFRRRLYGGEALYQAMKDGKVHASLCGHVHKPFIHHHSENSYEICAGSITAYGHLNVLEINQVDGTLQQHWEIIDYDNTVKPTQKFCSLPNLDYSTDNIFCINR